METVLSAAWRQVAIEIGDASAVGAARRLASELARNIGLDETRTGEAALAATEAATNILKHAGRGEMLFRPLQDAAGVGIEILAIDRGPGMSDVAHSMQDGTTTAGSYGIGLGAMRRLADVFDLYTTPGKGTVVAMTLHAKGRPPSTSAVQVGAVCLPMPGETVCGDAWAIAAGSTLVTVMAADGLGHGIHAAAASEAAADVIAERPDRMPAEAVQDIHLALRATRGAAVAVARLDFLAEDLRFAGVGNIMASVYENGSRRQLVSHNGIVGNNLHKVQEFAQAWKAGSILLLCSDGIGTRWDLGQYPGLALHDANVIAAVLYRDFVRGRDDATVLVIREHRD
ncbi:ATP-binding SpoIIE family protein phosphatase [Noviherbaspirillum sp.]|uniref:ATP-binding SpoIIE family protein phosphatase n=1 Tax=Noviherbaspirillum sp. TaxID=1926288 RepID=UPI002D62124F|nr:ATP-binding SpoIIE family protein phosphatase [Noviherbaspirillum sp.]HZW20190.1 ATP-binding SpoIIE family protein phosphatase [Noviherbaspirillum sp.]